MGPNPKILMTISRVKITVKSKLQSSKICSRSLSMGCLSKLKVMVLAKIKKVVKNIKVGDSIITSTFFLIKVRPDNPSYTSSSSLSSYNSSSSSFSSLLPLGLLVSKFSFINKPFKLKFVYLVVEFSFWGIISLFEFVSSVLLLSVKLNCFYWSFFRGRSMLLWVVLGD